MGAQLENEIRLRMSRDDYLQKTLIPFFKSDGAATYQAFLESHNRTYPQYVREIEGIAEGSKVAFFDLFVQNLVEEMSYSAPEQDAKRIRRVDHCSDYMVCPDPGATCLLGHNEDSGPQDINTTVLVVTPDWSAFTYAGDLPTGAFGWSRAAKFAFTLNYMAPRAYLAGGLGRGFVSRSLLDASGLDDALSRAVISGQCGGHNYQLMRTESPVRIVTVEVASNAAKPDSHFGPQIYSVRDETGAAPFFHANQYQTLNSLPQWLSNSSTHRIARAAALPVPSSASELLAVLGDQKDWNYPIFHDQGSFARGDKSGTWTLATALFDLVAGKVTLFQGSPAKKNPTVVFQDSLN